MARTKNKEPVGQRIIDRLRDFTESLESGEDISERYRSHSVSLDFRPTRYTPRRVRETRNLLGINQAVFARFLGVSPRTLRAWEKGLRKPNDVAARFMDEIRRDPDYWSRRLAEVARQAG